MDDECFFFCFRVPCSDFHRALATQQNFKKSHHRRKQKIACVATTLGDLFIHSLIHVLLYYFKLRERTASTNNLDKMYCTDLRIGEVEMENKFVSYNSSSSSPFSVNGFDFSYFCCCCVTVKIISLLNELSFVDDILKSEVIKLEFVFIYRSSSVLL